MAPIPDLIYFCSACHIPFSKHLSLVPSVSIHFLTVSLPFPSPNPSFYCLASDSFHNAAFSTVYHGALPRRLHQGGALKCLLWQETKTQQIANHIHRRTTKSEQIRNQIN